MDDNELTDKSPSGRYMTGAPEFEPPRAPGMDIVSASETEMGDACWEFRCEVWHRAGEYLNRAGQVH